MYKQREMYRLSLPRGSSLNKCQGTTEWKIINIETSILYLSENPNNYGYMYVYLVTEHVSILNNPSAFFCSGNETTHSIARHTPVIQNKIIMYSKLSSTLKTQIPHKNRNSDSVQNSRTASVRAVMVGSKKCARVGNWSERERESRLYFVPDHDCPIRSRPRYLLPPSIVPTYGILFPSRLFPVPPCCRFPSFPVPPSAQLFPFHPDVRTQFLPFRNSFKCQMFPSHLLYGLCMFSIM